MPYATQQDLVDRFGEDEVRQLTDRANTGAIDATVADQALADASEEMDGYIGARYQLPLATTPTVLVRLCADIARYRLYDAEPLPAVAQRYKDAVAFLTQISKGTVTLGLPATQQDAPSGAAQASAPQRVFTEGSLSDYQGWDYGSH